jgi:hypothetical protein
MYQPKSLYLSPAPRRQGFFLPIVLFFTIAGLAALLMAMFANGFSNPFTDLYLLPWIALVAAVVVAPIIYLGVKKRFDLFHPLVFAAWSYFIPAFVLGSLILASGLSEPFYLAFIPDLEYFLPLTLVYIALGFAGLTFGFALPFGKRLGDALSRRLPVWDWRPGDILFPGLLLLAAGVFFSTSAFTAGILGYQRSQVLEVFDATLATFTYFVPVASFVLWYAIFRTEQRTLNFKITAIILIALVPFSTVLAGSRGGLIHNLLPIAMAFWLSGRRIKLHHGVIFGVLLTGAVLLGVIYGTTFRRVKGDEEQVDFNVYMNQSGQALQIMSDRGLKDNMTFALDTFAQRIETTSSLAVVVANYEQLENYASDYGLAGNIWTYTWTAFIPRFLWPDKPIVSDSRAYSALYFDYGDNSFAITPMGDLLRNFGPLGVPIGMALLGFILRVMYVSLIEGPTKSVWRSAAYYLLLVNVSYEGFYGTIIPSLLRLSVILLLAGVFISLIARKRHL